ncbi:MAG TPA: M20 family metallopeptidase [Thermohalobaculum sp.]|nr:M20 family metallopeptidase [Thermohalobaculum sp.]
MADSPAILDWLAGRGPEMEALLADLVNIDSNSHDAGGIAAVADRLAAFFAEHGVETRRVPTDGIAEALVARVGPQVDEGHVLLLGHMDTVFPKGEAARRPFRVEGRIGHGPGCSDMKSGLVMNAFLMAGFAATGEAPLPLVALYTCDEEIGSPAGRPVIEAHARGARAVFNAEPARANGNVVSSRRGGTFFRATVTGRAAHSGLNPHDGRSAVEEMARKILAWHALTGEKPDVSVNVGVVHGGEVVNMVAPFAEALIDLRFAEPETGVAREAEIGEIARTCARDGLSGTIERTGGFLPVVETPASRALLEIHLGAARDLGLDTGAEFTRSCADSGFTAAIGVPTVCATGPVGGKAHSPDEYVELDSFVPRAQTVALAIARLA